MTNFMKTKPADTHDPAACKKCLHQNVCQYKQSYIQVEEKLKEIIASLPDASWCKITAECAYKDCVPHE